MDDDRTGSTPETRYITLGDLARRVEISLRSVHRLRRNRTFPSELYVCIRRGASNAS